ncbi:TPA: hypothetical protein N0F65_011685 [Lagenidium giganteum]|uniref:DDE Tnp4 domain-containing protein n=1 Tax=Lagenidium giganteum TaxID=4803 RepID=A0AAV2Z7I9_9STRA|nr:TPA: hypothetical protein N0F65_011685 [Lagenidium giganteum]
MIAFHTAIPKKNDDELDLEDTGPMLSEFPHKGYQGIQNHLRAIIPKKRPPRQELSDEDKSQNIAISTNRIIVENWLGRGSTLWRIIACWFTWDHSLYNFIAKICALVAQTTTFAFRRFDVERAKGIAGIVVFMRYQVDQTRRRRSISQRRSTDSIRRRDSLTLVDMLGDASDASVLRELNNVRYD